MKLTLEQVYYKLNLIKKQVDIKKEDSFDNKKVFKYLYNSLLDLIDEMEFVKETDDLFEDDYDFAEEEKKFDQSDPENGEKDEWSDIMEDLIDDD
jgi:hypothetical protein